MNPLPSFDKSLLAEALGTVRNAYATRPVAQAQEWEIKVCAICEQPLTFDLCKTTDCILFDRMIRRKVGTNMNNEEVLPTWIYITYALDPRSPDKPILLHSHTSSDMATIAAEGLAKDYGHDLVHCWRVSVGAGLQALRYIPAVLPKLERWVE